MQRDRLEDYLKGFLGPSVRILDLHELGGQASGAAALKAFGYGRPLCVELEDRGRSLRLVLRQVRRNGFGRERSADRAAAVWLDFTTFNHLPGHIQAQDMVGLDRDGRLHSLGHLEDLLLLTDYASGRPYAEDLWRIQECEQCDELDHRRAAVLARYLAGIHEVKHDDPLLWRRRLRDLVGHGEGIMGLADSYPPKDPLATPERLQAIEAAANRWRWRLKPLAHRLSQVHGDFHPFNVLFGEGDSFRLLDRSRGEWGEPADDVSCLSINFLFFSLQGRDRLAGPFLELYTTFWESYLAARPDEELLAVIQPWFAWRALVLASPQWYPNTQVPARRKLLTFARRVMDEERFAWTEINTYLEE